MQRAKESGSISFAAEMRAFKQKIISLNASKISKIMLDFHNGLI